MSKSKRYCLGMIATLVSLVVFSYILFDKKIEAHASTIVQAGEPYFISFNQALTVESVTDGNISIVDQQGKAVKATLQLDAAAKVLSIEGLAVGNYTIHVKKAAFKSGKALQKDNQFDLQVVNKITKITSQQDLKAYFTTFLMADKSPVIMEAESKEESKMLSDVAMDSASGGGAGYSTTNNQVEGIEEGDIAITDGQYIYSIVDNRIMITDAKNMKVVKKLVVSKDAYPSHLMLHENTLIVAYSTYIETSKEPYYDGKSVAKVAFYDVKDANNPKLIREIGQDGYLTNLRKAGNYLYVVSNQTPNYWMLREVEDMDLLPYTYDTSGVDQALPFGKIRILPESNTPNYLIVSAIDVSNIASAKLNTESYLGNSGQLYMSQNAIYMASMNYSHMLMMRSEVEATSEVSMPAEVNETTIYKIAVDKTSIRMAAQGKVKGSVLNQFSMDEHNGYIRIATTEGNAWGSEANSKNHLFILDNALKQVGSVNDLAQGERIYSARFMGEKAYIVTFKETDPLFVIDTKNPQAPKVLGELKIPGFSNYLHPIGENHLLGIGYDTEVKMESGSKEPIVLTKGMKLSLFNVTDLANPIEQDAVIIGGRGTYSEVQNDHKALFRDARNNYYGFPITIYEPGEDEDRLTYKGTGAQIYKVTTAGIELAGDLTEPARPGEQYEDSYNVVQRILYTGDNLYTVSRTKITSYQMSTFKKQQMIGF
ncbi:beta-propeller domain-containing protein [Solibacillus sp. FSL K6-1523]|uniref:beta-propeller domain-containing protein n=1 Tax=Solibacillus sp. FSL K6-1523 TaxID=2921471 RepID=UPI0030F61BAF